MATAKVLQAWNVLKGSERFQYDAEFMKRAAEELVE